MSATAMHVEFINSFIDSVRNVFSSMLSSKVESGQVAFVKDDFDLQGITVLIGLSGPLRGTIAFSCPEATALAMVSRLLGTEKEKVDATVSDGVAEIVNIIVGGAKVMLVDENGPPVDLSLPIFIRGSSYTVDCPSDSPWLEVPFESSLGDLSLRVTFQMEKVD